MLFSSLPFLFFFLPLFFAAYILTKNRSVRNFILLAFSLFFYGWGEPVYILLMVFSIAVNYTFALLIVRSRSKNQDGGDNGRAKLFLILAVAINLLFIGIFKYADFFLSVVSGITGMNMPKLNIPLPIGISFYTFQVLSYVIDVYWKTVSVQKNIMFLGAYVVGFPQLIAGPIVRYETIANELVNRRENMEDVAEGLRRFTAGLAKKVFIANNMAAVADAILGYEPSKAGALGMWIAIIAYTLQIYYDFSGYSDMAIGLGRMMGFHYLENFNYPYIATSVTDFWRRWHISLSSFFRDYVYIPLGGNRVSKPRWALNTMIVWLLTGLWHGASFTFVLWGVYFGALLLIEKTFLQNNIVKIPVIRNIYALAAILFGWVIFRAESVSHIGTIVSTMFGANGSGSLLALASSGTIKPIYIAAGIAGIICATPVSGKIKAMLLKRKELAYVIDISSCCALIYCIMVLIQGAYNPFIYFRF